MSCSARLPVYTLMIAVLIPGRLRPGKAGIMLCMYLIGIVAAFAHGVAFQDEDVQGRDADAPAGDAALSDAFAGRRGHPHVGTRGPVPAPRRHRDSGAFDSALGAGHLSRSRPIPRPRPPRRSRTASPGAWATPSNPPSRPSATTGRSASASSASFAAREVFVSTMSIVYNVETKDKENIESAAGHHARRTRAPMAGPSSRRSFASG